jgi:hypothetical protein
VVVERTCGITHMAHLDTLESEELWLSLWGKLLLAASLGVAVVFALATTGIHIETLSAEITELRQWREADRVRIKTLELEVGGLRKLVLLKRASEK